MGSESLKKERKKLKLLLERRWGIHCFLGGMRKQKNVLTVHESTYSYLSFPKGLEHAPDHVMTPTLLSNKKLRGIEHAHFEKKGQKSNPSTFWARPTRAVMKRGLDW
jgi:phosphoglycerol transferase MdoB-like AlkP superfamily enzyme